LASFADGLFLAEGRDLVVVAHSNGSVVAGQALANDGLRADRVVVAGSPGMDVDWSVDLHTDSGAFYALRAPGDFVANDLSGHGTDPSSPMFGGTRLATNGDGFDPVSGHSEYFDPNTQSLKSVVDVINDVVVPGDVQGDSAGDWTRAWVDEVSSVVDVNRLVSGVVADHYDGPGAVVPETIANVYDGVDGMVAHAAGDAVDWVKGLFDS
jgi:hypothetical protein